MRRTDPFASHEEKFTDYTIDFADKHRMLQSADPISEQVQAMVKKAIPL
jgi:hypothetical protein